MGDIDVPLPADQMDPSMVETDDGGVVVSFDDQTDMSAAMDHNANLAEHIAEKDLAALATDLLTAVEDDDKTRADWKQMYIEGLNLLGLKIDKPDRPFPGACGVHHPFLATAVVEFANRALAEFFPPAGPVKVSVRGAHTKERMDQGERVRNFMNHMLLDEMEEYFPDEDQLYVLLPIAGCAFKKVYVDPVLGRATSRLILPQDFITSYHTTDLFSAPRVTHVVRYTRNELRKAQVSGFYQNVDLTDGEETRDEIKEATDGQEGKSPSHTARDDRDEVYESHVDLDLPGFEDPDGIAYPYVVAIHKQSAKVLSIRRNWREGDPGRRKRMWFTKFPFIRGLGFYDWGYTHLIGGIAYSATTILRQLIDAGTLANLPAGFKSKGLNVGDNAKPLEPGEWRDVEGTGDDIRQSLLPLPYKGPDATLAQLLGALLESGMKMVAASSAATGEMNPQAPVGTTLALLDEAGRIIGGVFKRIHDAKAHEFKLLHDLFAETLQGEYPYEIAGAERAVMQADFDGRVDVVPVSDPNATSATKRIMMAQTKLQAAMQAPQMHDMRVAFSDFYEAIGADDVDRIMPPPPQAATADPVTENTTMLAGGPVKPAIEQDHRAHINAHLAFAQMVMGGAATAGAAPTVIPAIQAHTSEHVAMLYTVETARRTGIPVQMIMSGQMPPEIQSVVAQASAEVAAEMAQMFQAGKPADPAQALVQVETMNAQQRDKDSQRKYDLGMRELAQKAENEARDDALDIAAFEHKTRMDVAGHVQKAQTAAAKTVENAPPGS